MSHFSAYNTSDSNTQNLPLAANAVITPMTLTAATEGLIVGTVASDQNGTLFIDQSFDGQNWDVTNSINVTGAAAGTYGGVEVNQTVYAPYVQVRYVNGGTAQTFCRIFLRAVGIRTS